MPIFMPIALHSGCDRNDVNRPCQRPGSRAVKWLAPCSQELHGAICLAGTEDQKPAIPQTTPFAVPTQQAAPGTIGWLTIAGPIGVLQRKVMLG
jgi:hypothetical protein